VFRDVMNVSSSGGSTGCDACIVSVNQKQIKREER
jgi:hypothetical protein